MSNRGRRGNGREMFADGERNDEPRPEDDILVIDAETNEPIVFDEPAVVEVEDEPAPVVEQQEEDPLAVLQRNHDALKRDRDIQAAALRDAEQRATTAEKEALDNAAAMIATAERETEGAIKNARARYAACRANNDVEGELAAMDVITNATAQLREIKSAKAEFEANIATRAEPETRPAPKPQQQQNQPVNDIGETTVGNPKYVSALMDSFPPAIKTWAEKHKGTLFKSDADLQKAFRVNAAAAAIGHEPGTPGYFTFMERELALSEPQQQPAPRRHMPQKRPPVAAAPVTNRTRPNAQTQVALTKEQLAMAGRLGMTPAKYALRVKQAQDGANDPNYTGPKLSRDNPANQYSK